MRRRFFVSLFLLVAGALFVACDDDLVSDATFRMWCGDDQLCAWKLETGHIRRAPTWHKNDPGVELVDTPTAISQEVDKSARCLVFTTIADVDAAAQVTVSLDFDKDGTVDYEQPVAAVGFHEVKSEVSAPVLYSGFKITITKKGEGHAVLAQMRVQEGSSCTAPPLRLHDQPLGAPCTLGEPSECKSGVCCEGACAECCTDPKFFDLGPDAGVAQPPVVTCPGGAACVRRDVPQAAFLVTVVPKQCDPGKHLRPAGASCLAGDDCASGVCDGASWRANDADRLMPDAGLAPCEPDFPDAGGSTCTFVSVRGGTCR